MGSSKKNDMWRAEREREERKKRLAKMKGSNGGKIKISTFNWAKFITILVIIVFIAGFFTIDVFSRGIPYRYISALSVGDDNVSVVEYNFYYNTSYNNFVNQYYDYLSYFNLDTSKPLKDQQYSETMTWEQYFHDQAINTIQQVSILYEHAKAENIQLTSDDTKSIDDYIEQIQSFCSTNGMKVADYYTTAYGKGATEQTLRTIFEKQHLADKYAIQKRDSYTFDDTQITEYYDSNKDTFDVVDYRTFFISGEIKASPVPESDDPEATAEPTPEPTEEEEAAAMTAAKERADEMLSKIKSENDFAAMALEYADESSKSTYEDTTATLREDAHKSDISDTATADWMFAAERKSGDKTVIETDTGYYVLYFVTRLRYEYNPVNVRHILISTQNDDGTSFTEEQKTAAKEEADKIYEDWKAGAATEESFAALATEKSADTGSKTEGGLYEDVPLGQMMPEFDEWIYDSSRKPGDSGIIETDYGYHIMYFVGKSDMPYWKTEVKNTLISNAYNDFFTAEKEANPIKEKGFGMGMTKK